MNAYIACLLIAAGLLYAAMYHPPKRKPDWRHLSVADRFDIYERARFAAMGCRDLEHNIRREADGILAKAWIIKQWRDT